MSPFPVNQYYLSLAVTIIIYLILLISLLISFIKDWKFFVKGFLILIFIITVSISLNSDYSIDRIIIFIKFILNCFSIFMIIYLNKDIKGIFDGFHLGCYFNTFIVLIYYLMLYNNMKMLSLQGQTLSYVISFYTVIYIYNIFKEFKLKDLIGIIINIFVVMQLGSRTVLAVILLYLCYRIINFVVIKYKNYILYNKKKIIIASSLFLFFLILFIMNIQNISSHLNDMLVSQGIHNRFIRLLSEGNFITSSSGRVDSFYTVILDNIIKNPFGYGFAYDRVLIYDYHLQTISEMEKALIVFEGSYSHNFFLEIFSNYGIVLGLFIIMKLFKYTYQAIRTKVFREEIIALIFVGFFPLMLTSSVLVYKFFWIFIALLMLIIKKKDDKYEEN